LNEPLPWSPQKGLWARILAKRKTIIVRIFIKPGKGLFVHVTLLTKDTIFTAALFLDDNAIGNFYLKTIT
jgi:hypothetical protein